jgi:D-3-phosphoglycerate dehydrogenase
MKKKVLIPTKLDGVAKTLLEASGKYHVIQQETKDLPGLARQHPDTYALIVRSEAVDAALLEALTHLKVVVRAGAGYNTIDIKHARSRGVDVMNTPGANSNGVAEEVIGLMLADARHLLAADASCRRGEWEKTKFMGRELAGKTLGIVGLGAIGRLVARRASGFDMTLLGYDPMVSADRAREMGVEPVSLAELFERSDFVTLHIPATPSTRNLVGADLLGRMKTGATVINCARCEILDEAALRAVKAEKKLRFLNDVYPKDEAGPKTCADIADIMVPHLGASTVESNTNAARMAAEIILDFDAKGISPYIVNRDIPAGLDESYSHLAYALAGIARALLGPNRRLKSVETSVYGDLKPFADWLTVPIACALFRDFQRTQDHRAALKLFKDSGVDVINREVEPQKKYGNSITLDLTAGEGGDTLRQVSLRGTVTEGRCVVSRINQFHGLYFEPKGPFCLFTYRDRPGVLGLIASTLAGAGINIDDVRNPHDESGEHSIAILKVNKAVPQVVIDDIAERIEAQVAVGLSL